MSSIYKEIDNYVIFIKEIGYTHSNEYSNQSIWYSRNISCLYNTKISNEVPVFELVMANPELFSILEKTNRLYYKDDSIFIKLSPFMDIRKQLKSDLLALIEREFYFNFIHSSLDKDDNQ